MKRTIALVIAAGAMAAALIAAGLSGAGNMGYPGYGPSGSVSRPATARAVVSLATTRLGRVLVDGRGRTLYLFERDRGTASTCYEACATYWPPLTTRAKPHAGRGVLGSKLATTRRKDGTLEVTYNGHPLYAFVADTKRGDTKGQDLNQFGGDWFVLSPAGRKIEGGGA